MKIEFRLLWQINCPLRCELAGNEYGSWDYGARELQRAVFVRQGDLGTAPRMLGLSVSVSGQAAE